MIVIFLVLSLNIYDLRVALETDETNTLLEFQLAVKLMMLISRRRSTVFAVAMK